MTTEKKFPRTSKPMPDRDDQIKMFEQLVDFLAQNSYGFPLPEAKRFFSSVSTTEASRIFEFLISRIRPDFKISKLEVDVPEALTTLDYPFIRSVTKSALVSVTTRQAIVNLLIIYDWLVRYLIHYNICAPDEDLFRRIFAEESNNSRESDVPDLDDFDRLIGEENATLEKNLKDSSSIRHELEGKKEIDTKEKLLIGDIETCNEYNTKMKEYIQTWKINNKALEGRLTDNRTNREKSELELTESKLQAETEYENLRNDEKRLLEESARLKQNIGSLKSEVQSQKDPQIADLKLELSLAKEMLEEKKLKADEEIKSAQARDDAEKAQQEKALTLIDGNMEMTLEGLYQEAKSMTNDARRKLEESRKVLEISKKNNRIVKAACKAINSVCNSAS